MLNTLIRQRASEWFAAPDCPSRALVDHITAQGFLRGAQVDAIKTYLFLKIVGRNRPLAELFGEGFFTPRKDLSELHISQGLRVFLEENPPARALFEFARGKDRAGAPARLPELEAYLLDHAAEADCTRIIKEMFSGVLYSDYLFSLPMGAGKTFLMAAIIYLDLYFGQNEPDNPVWARNFVLLVPSGLKSSILPSLRTIENFDPAWVLPEPAAGNLRKHIRFEVLDQSASANRSNKARNPNAAKIASHQPFDDLAGLVLVTNAEKVILDRANFSDEGDLIEETEDEKEQQANELRGLIGKIPHLRILIDEVHHAATDDIKLRQVVNRWSEGGRFNGVLGFSGTPYLSSPKSVAVAAGVTLRLSQITNTVFYYPLTRAIETFLKKPAVRVISEVDALSIVRRGVEEFQARYSETFYQGGQTAKLAVYCGSIERLEKQICPLLLEMGVPADDILKYHRGNKQHRLPASAELEWRTLDSAASKKRVILLVQIGKEGWDCRSLTGVILSQKGDCPSNMVLQTSCRCLRQMDGGDQETAGIWLNADNAKTLDKQLREEQHTSIQAINALGQPAAARPRPRVARSEHLKLPRLDYFQLNVRYDTLTAAPATPQETLATLDVEKFRGHAEIVTRGMNPEGDRTRRMLDHDLGDSAGFNAWLLRVAKGGFGAVPLGQLRAFETELRAIFDAITYEDGEAGIRRFNALYDEGAIAARVRLAFQARRTLSTTKEVIPKGARMLVVEKLRNVASDEPNLFPSESECAQILKIDASGRPAEEYATDQRRALDVARAALVAQGMDVGILPTAPVAVGAAVKNKDRSFHYVPYKFDSGFELAFLTRGLESESLQARGLELYFNGETELTEFRIECFSRSAASGWNRIGGYFPDFLVLQRREGKIYRALIVETKGEGFAAKFRSRREFVETEWLRLNNEKFGYRRFDYLYLEGKMDAAAQRGLERKVAGFFED